MTTESTETTNLNHMALVRAVSAESGVSQAVVRAVLRATFDVIGRTVANGYKVRVTNFGTWRRKVLANTRNPQTGEAAGPSASVSFRSTGRLSVWAKAGQAHPADTLAKAYPED